MRNPTSVDEFLDFLDQAIFETSDLVASAEEEGDNDEFAQYLPVYETLAAELQKLHAAVREGRHEFADGGDLPFMPLVQKWKQRIPMHDLLEILNSAHKRGF